MATFFGSILAIASSPPWSTFCFSLAVGFVISAFLNLAFLGASASLMVDAERLDLFGEEEVPVDVENPGERAEETAREKLEEHEEEDAEGHGRIGIDQTEQHALSSCEPWLMKHFRSYWECLLSSSWLKAIVIFVFCVYLLGGISGFLQCSRDPHRSTRSPDIPRVALPEAWRSDPLRAYRVSLYINESIDYWNVETRERLMAMLNEFESFSLNTSRLTTNCWFREIPRLSGTEETADIESSNSSNRENDIRALKEMLSSKPFSEFNRDIKFNENGTAIEASRCKLLARRIVDANDEMTMLRNLERIAAKYPDLKSWIAETLEEGFTVWAFFLGAFFSALFRFASWPFEVQHSILFCVWSIFSVISLIVGAVGSCLWFAQGSFLAIYLTFFLVTCYPFHECYTTQCAFLGKPEADSDEKARAAFRCLLFLFVVLYIGSFFCVYMMFTTETPKYVWVSWLKVVALIASFDCFQHILLLPALVSSEETFRKVMSKMSSIISV
ncbi:uncharacterized protein LOC100899061 [Galendromus occidentalis]|uniref:Uncharacterized protein LOC100899061 n=1 Tax=Galendromus occidentalis TaxID=34638 RepID=A0AAJ6QNI5_9ACAR|nr:uncharacterized protein LOC100899061 [Galendromus occidentalis]